jgi:uncharacterized BrkB/YihY/UPF0761 family membrane protein
MFAAFKAPLSWGELLKRAAKETNDDCLGPAAQLAYYVFLAVFPAILFPCASELLSAERFIDDIVRSPLHRPHAGERRA